VIETALADVDPAAAGHRDFQEEIMFSHTSHIKQTIVLAGLTLAMVVTGAAPLLGDHGVEAARKGKKSHASGDVTAEAVLAFSNPTSIKINEGTNGSPAPATPYGSEIEVSGFDTNVADVEVTIHGFSHVNPQDVGVLLVGPEGQMAGLLAASPTTVTAPGVTVTFDDQAPSEAPNPLVSGTFQPNGGAGNFPAPAPSPQQNSSALAVFNGTNPNGTWRLFVADFQSLTPNSTGTIAGGWSLNITTANGVPTAKSDSFSAKAGKTLAVPADGVLGNDSDPDGDALTAIITGQPKKGTVSLQPDGSFIYKSKKTAKGMDSFTYLAEDSGGLNALATVNIQLKKGKKGKK
jgi:hypothetical protein